MKLTRGSFEDQLAQIFQRDITNKSLGSYEYRDGQLVYVEKDAVYSTGKNSARLPGYAGPIEMGGPDTSEENPCSVFGMDARGTIFCPNTEAPKDESRGAWTGTLFDPETGYVGKPVSDILGISVFVVLGLLLIGVGAFGIVQRSKQ